MRLLIKWATLTLAIYIIATYTGYITIVDTKTAIIAAFTLGVLNILVKPVLKLFALPITLLTFGLFSLVINGIILAIVPHIIAGFTIKSFWYGVLSAFMISVITAILNSILVPKKED